MHLFQDETGEGTTPSSFWGYTHQLGSVGTDTSSIIYNVKELCLLNCLMSEVVSKWNGYGWFIYLLFSFKWDSDIHARHQISDISFPLSADFSAAWSFVMGKKIPTGPMQLAGAIHTNSSVIVWLTLKSYSHEAPTLIFTDHYSQKSSQLDSNGNVPIY